MSEPPFSPQPPKKRGRKTIYPDRPGRKRAEVLPEQTYRQMEYWLQQMADKLIAHRQRLIDSRTQENAEQVDAHLYYEHAKASVMKWLIGLARQAGDRRESARRRKEGTEQIPAKTPKRKKGE